MNPTSTLTLSNGSPVDDNQNSLTAGPDGPILLGDLHLIDKLAHFDRERIPERAVHAKGAGAHGYFECTNDVTKYCKAKFLDTVGKRTPVFVRFSTTAGENGSADTVKDPRGMAVKFYTEEGNWDMTGNNTPVFFIRDPMKFPDLIHSRRKDPQSNLKSATTWWDFFSWHPESAHNVGILNSDRGTPDGYRHIHGFGSHTFKWVNSNGEVFFVKFHFKTDSGIKNLPAAEALRITGTDPDYATRDLFQHIKSGKTATWTCNVQVMPEADAATYRWNVLDVTKVWPHGDYPLIPFGKIVLNRNPNNYFAETEQAAFNPGNLVPGIEPSNDRVLQGRLFSYPDTHRHRLGANFNQIPINCPYRAKVSNHQRDGPATVNGNYGSLPNYEPNSFGLGPRANSSYGSAPFKVSGMVQRYVPAHPNDDFAQPGVFFRKVLTNEKRDILISNIVVHLKQANRDVQERMVKIFHKVDPEYGHRVAQGLGHQIGRAHV